MLYYKIDMSMEHIHKLVEAARTLETVKLEGFEDRFDVYMKASDNLHVVKADALRRGVQTDVIENAKAVGEAIAQIVTRNT